MVEKYRKERRARKPRTSRRGETAERETGIMAQNFQQFEDARIQKRFYVRELNVSGVRMKRIDFHPTLRTDKKGNEGNAGIMGNR